MATSAENGFSLIEVLVAIFVLAIGVVGAVGMQLTALRISQQSALQTKALHFAVEMADSMFANTRGMEGNPYLGVDYQASIAVDLHSGPRCYGKEAACDADELAGFEVQNFLQRMAHELPDARIRICQDAQPWDTTRRQYRWDCMHASNAATAIKIGWAGKNSAGPAVGVDTIASAPDVVLMLASRLK